MKKRLIGAICIFLAACLNESGGPEKPSQVTTLPVGPIEVIVDNPLDTNNRAQSSLCPENFVPLPFLSGYTRKEFCVSKYEMKNDGSHNAVSQANGIPYTTISRDEAILKCQDMGLGYDLISNDEWQTVARNIELVPSNWAHSTVGSLGGLNAGHTDEQPDQPLAASDDDKKPCFQTGQACSQKDWHNQKRTHTISNGEIIWDISGNVHEWMKDTDNSGIEVNHYGFVSIVQASEDPLIKEVFGPQGDYNKGLQLGSLSLKPNMGTIYRGGGWDDGSRAGLFAASTAARPNEAKGEVGFRCVYYP